MKKVIRKREDDIVSLKELSVNNIYGVSMNYENGQKDIMVIKDTTRRTNVLEEYYFESMVLGHSYPTTCDTLQEIVATCLDNDAYDVFEFDNLLDFFKWSVEEIEEIMQESGVSSYEFAGLNEKGVE